jgi:hypothetical protein
MSCMKKGIRCTWLEMNSRKQTSFDKCHRSKIKCIVSTSKKVPRSMKTVISDSEKKEPLKKKTKKGNMTVVILSIEVDLRGYSSMLDNITESLKTITKEHKKMLETLSKIMKMAQGIWQSHVAIKTQVAYLSRIAEEVYVLRVGLKVQSSQSAAINWHSSLWVTLVWTWENAGGM